MYECERLARRLAIGKTYFTDVYKKQMNLMYVRTSAAAIVNSKTIQS
jgi:hypothetical protein